MIKIGIDGGGGFVKICLSFTDFRADASEIKKSSIDLKYSDAGVKKIIIIGIVPNYFGIF